MNLRQVLPLALLYGSEEHQIEGRTRFQKLTFLMQKEGNLDTLEPTDTYRFEPYDYGPFSTGLYDDLDALIEKGLIDERVEEIDNEEGVVKYEYQLQPDGRQFIEDHLQEKGVEEIVQEAQKIVDEFDGLRLPELIDRVYSMYPDYAENSVLR